MLPTKPALRAAMRARLRALPPDERRERSARLLTRVTGRDDWRHARVVGLFAPLRSEPDMDQLWTLPGALRGKTVVYPRVGPGGIVLHAVNRLEDLMPAAPGNPLREPRAEASPVSQPWPDVLLVPGLAFTHDGGRLGRGGGHYDRLLTRPGRTGCRVLGVAFEFQLVPALPQEAHDADLDEVVTDSPSGA